jgi:pimeloyl-ACP methyl ester carboxylesterase
MGAMHAVDEVQLEDGRGVAVHRVADGQGERTVVLCHIAPGSGGFDPEPEQTRSRAVRLLGVDRPGYGGSDPVAAGQWATVASAADDLAEVLVRRGTGPVGVAGWSAGGRVALALAARRPDLVDRVVVVATPAPNEEVPWIPEAQNQMLEALRGQPPAVVHAQLSQGLAAMVPADPSAPEALTLLGAGPADEGGHLRRGRPPAAGRDAPGGVHVGAARPGGRHRRLLPAAVGLPTVGRQGQDAAAVRLQGPRGRPATRTVVAATPARRPPGGVARGRPPAGDPPVAARAVASRAQERPLTAARAGFTNPVNSV